MTFEEYLITKKIDQTTFRQAEPDLYESWRIEFEQVHHNSFTAQKLYLINPLRRKYLLKQALEKTEKNEVTEVAVSAIVVEDKPTEAVPTSQSIEQKINPQEVKPEAQSPKPVRPVFKPKPKIT